MINHEKVIWNRWSFFKIFLKDIYNFRLASIFFHLFNRKPWSNSCEKNRYTSDTVMRHNKWYNLILFRCFRNSIMFKCVATYMCGFMCVCVPVRIPLFISLYVCAYTCVISLCAYKIFISCFMCLRCFSFRISFYICCDETFFMLISMKFISNSVSYLIEMDCNEIKSLV